MAKGGSTTSEVTIPEYIENAARSNLTRADQISKIGYVPYYGPDVAAFTPNQQAAFQNNANAASAFGMAGPTSRRDIMGGMGAPTQYANGVQGYSSQPMYQQSLDMLQADRPGQFDYLNSFFIDPQTGARGANAAPDVDYTAIPTNAERERERSDPDMSYQAPQGAPQSSGYNTSTISMNSPTSYMRGGVNDPNLESGLSQSIARLSSTNGMESTAEGSSYGDTGSTAPPTSIRPVARSDNGGGSSGGGGGCVVATHAVASGAFTPNMKREAVVWCMDVLHGKWWGEAIRRGYRYSASKKIEQGKAREHYDEFRRYIAFANGKQRTLRGAATFTFRTVQFFALGMIKRSA